MDKKLKFKIKLEGMEGSSVAAIIAPFSVEEVFGTKAGVPVKGTINGYPFRSSLMPMCGQHRMVVNREIREGAGCKVGDIVSVVMERDHAERTVEVPPLLKNALTKSKTAKEQWNSHSFTHQKEMARFIAQAKQEETQTRRLAKVMNLLKTGKKWMGH
jgi:ribosomal protein L11